MGDAQNSTDIPSRPAWAGGLLCLSAATMLLEITLTRLFSVAQFYHFAFMIISLAMLGLGASGTLLALFPHLGRRRPRVALAGLALSFGACAVGAYLLTNLVPFDSFSIAWDRRQVLILALHYGALALPFFASGMVLGMLLAGRPTSPGPIYAANLVGSAAGCFLALVVPAALGGVGTVLLCGALGALAAVVFVLGPVQFGSLASANLFFYRGGRRGHREKTSKRQSGWRKPQKLSAISAIESLPAQLRRASGKGQNPQVRPALLPAGLAISFLLLCAAALFIRPAFFNLRLSPYKGLSYALQYPDATVVSSRWNSFSRIDRVESRGIRSLPGLSYLYMQPPPPQAGLFVDGDDPSPMLELSPNLLEEPVAPELAFADYLPTAVAYRLRLGGEVLVLSPRGGLELWVALSQGAARVTAVEPNPLIVDAARSIYQYPQVKTVVEHPRSYLRSTAADYDLVVQPLVTPFHPIRSGAYSLAEDYTLTVESFRDALARLRPGGLFVVSRWLQVPPSEGLRTLALALTAIEQAGGDPVDQIVAYRGYAVLTMLVKNEPFTADELAAVRAFAAGCAFDLVYAPDLHPAELNRFNVLQEPVYSAAFASLLQAEDRAAWYADYPLDVTPPTDDRPFFGHFFRWSQAGQIVAEMGKTWQPFGGAGYFVLVVFLGLALVAAVIIVTLPLLGTRRKDRIASSVRPAGRPPRWRILGYFTFLGLGYLLVEIPLIQRFILFLGQPAYALTAVLFTLLLFSGLGSLLSSRLGLRWVLPGLIGLLLAYSFLLPLLLDAVLGWPWGLRLVLAVVVLAPAGLLMGIPFPRGLAWLGAGSPRLVPWAWAANGAASVVAAVLAALLALSIGFRWVLVLGAVCYAGAWLLIIGDRGLVIKSGFPNPQ